MKKIILVLICALVPALAFAQPAGSAGSSVPAPSPAPDAPPPPTPSPTPVAAADARKACTDAMNADPAFAKSIVDATDEFAAKKRLQLDLEQHQAAATRIQKNEKHVILAYAAMWIIAAAFVMFLWRRQQALKGEIASLKADLDAATKDGK